MTRLREKCFGWLTLDGLVLIKGGEGMDSEDIRSIFGRNLRKLVNGDSPVTEIARDLGINRTQLNRYIYGEAFPRPDILHRICTYFGVDARILTQSLDEIDAEQRHPALGSSPIPTLEFEPVSENVFPDGFYIEWKQSWIYANMFTKHLLQASTDNGTRVTRIRAPSGFRPDLKGARYKLPLIDFHGIAVNQSDGFAIFDQGRGTHGVAMTAFRKGFMNVENVFPGYKLSAVVFNRQRHHFKGPTILQYIGRNCADILQVARSPLWLTVDDIPKDILSIIELLEHEDRGLLPVPSSL